MQRVKILIQARLIILLVLILESLLLKAQAPMQGPDQVYGFDPLLYNGLVYRSFVLPQTKGTQYLLDAFDSQGTVTVRGITYSDVSINYDISNQKLVLKYKNAQGTPALIEISDAWLENFYLGGRHFEIETGTDSTKRIYQVLGTGTEKILYYRRKELKLDTRTESKDHFYSDPIIEMYVKADSHLIRFRKNKSFVSAFNPTKQDLIKKYIRKHKIRVKKANDGVMTELINYCNTLTGS